MVECSNALNTGQANTKSNKLITDTGQANTKNNTIHLTTDTEQPNTKKNTNLIVDKICSVINIWFLSLWKILCINLYSLNNWLFIHCFKLFTVSTDTHYMIGETNS